MRILVVGGTQFVGRHFATAATEAGHDLTLLHRGRTGSELFPQAGHLLLDRDGDLSPLAGRTFDATVDFCGYLPRQVTHLAEALDGRAGQYVFISSVSAYVDPPAPGATEASAELVRLDGAEGVTEVTNETYGGLKVACEWAAATAYGDALTIVRPTYVVGPWDPTGRFPWWVQRLARGGEVLAPGPADSPIQVIDARDQAAWLVGLVEAGITGAFHAASPPPPFGMGELLERSAAAIGPAGTTLTWVDGSWLAAAGQDGMSLPLWSEGSEEFALALDPAAAYASGLAPRPLEDTVRDTLAWAESSGDVTRQGVGLEPRVEAELLARWHAER
jgi:2'-hydroxyisoflavone reductase